MHFHEFEFKGGIISKFFEEEVVNYLDDELIKIELIESFSMKYLQDEDKIDFALSEEKNFYISKRDKGSIVEGKIHSFHVFEIELDNIKINQIKPIDTYFRKGDKYYFEILRAGPFGCIPHESLRNARVVNVNRQIYLEVQPVNIKRWRFGKEEETILYIKLKQNDPILIAIRECLNSGGRLEGKIKSKYLIFSPLDKEDIPIGGVIEERWVIDSKYVEIVCRT